MRHAARYVPFLLLLALFPVQTVASEKLEEVYVTAELMEKRLIDSSTSAMVLDEKVLRDRNANQLEDLIDMIPNLNYSSGASRGKYFQIRGIGPRSEFIEPMHPSVGVLIDGIDFSGVAGAATMLDLQQLEVLRGPQGTLYGANALAGLINMVSASPDKNSGETKLTLGNYGRKEFSQVIGGNVNDNLGLRVAAGVVKSDGFIRNEYLNRDDTNNIDEKTLKAHGQWQASDSVKLKFTGIRFDADNGYDAFTLDNSRNTLSDEPGKDANQTNAGSVNIDVDFDSLRWNSTVSALNSDSEYSYDVDWTFRTICAETDPCAYWQYSHFEEYLREKDNVVMDTRILKQQKDSFSYVVGAYFRDESSKLTRNYIDNDPNYSTFYGPITEQVTETFGSDYDTQNIALYTQWDMPLVTPDLVLNAGLRYETRDYDYKNTESESRSDSENFWGGKLALEYHGLDNQLAYALVSRGYKAGGANVPSASVGPATDSIPRFFDSESLWNFELGHKGQWLNSKLTSGIAIFYQQRNNIQVKQSVVTSQATGEVDDLCPCDFTDYTDNVDSAVNYGMELELRAYLNDMFSGWLFASALSADYENFESFSHFLADEDSGEPYDLSGRDQAHAPNYQMSTGVDISFLPNLVWQISADSKANFYLSSRHNETTESYVLLNSQLSFAVDSLELTLWGKNLTDEEVIVRGFGSFPNDPRDLYTTNGPYYQYGAPRQIGLSARLMFE